MAEGRRQKAEAARQRAEGVYLVYGRFSRSNYFSDNDFPDDNLSYVSNLMPLKNEPL
jgi:hypothetical protein